MAACDHTIIWFFNGQPQLQLEGESCLKVNSPHIVQIDYSTYGIKLLNGCTININRDCELYEFEPYPESSVVFSTPDLAQYTRRKNNKYVNEVDKEVIFLNACHSNLFRYYEEKPNYRWSHKLSRLLCPVYRKPRYKEKTYYYYDDTTFILYKNTCFYNAIFIYDLVNHYSLVGLGGYGHENNPYLHFMSRGYGEAFEMAMCFECYKWMINDILYDEMFSIIHREFCEKKPFNVIKKIPYGFSLSGSIPATDDSGIVDDHDVREYVDFWINKFSAVYRHSTQQKKYNNIVPTINNICIVNYSSMAQYNKGEYDIDPEYVEKLPKEAQLIVDDEECQYYLDELNSLPTKPHSKFVYTPKQFIKKWNKHIEDRNN